MVFKDYYKILCLETSKVSPEQIKIAFREQAKKYHPDVNIENSKIAEERFKDINEAYKILSENNAKKKYDRTWNAKIGRKKAKEESEKQEIPFDNVFNMFFGTKKQETQTEKIYKKIPTKGENVETEIDINLEDAYFGLEKKISLRAVNGKMKTFSVKIPAGIRNGEKIRLLGQGKAGTNGGKNGDLFIRINIENNKKFQLNGCDLITDLYITPWEAALGKRVTISSIEDNINVYIPPGIGSGEKIRIANKGYKDGQGSRGDLVAEIKTVVPKQLTDEEKELFEKLNNISTFNPRK